MGLLVTLKERDLLKSYIVPRYEVWTSKTLGDAPNQTCYIDIRCFNIREMRKLVNQIKRTQRQIDKLNKQP